MSMFSGKTIFGESDPKSILDDYEWAKEIKRWKVIPHAYLFKDYMIFLKNFVFGSSNKYRGTADFMPKAQTS
jgi:hypothetical protein